MNNFTRDNLKNSSVITINKNLSTDESYQNSIAIKRKSRNLSKSWIHIKKDDHKLKKINLNSKINILGKLKLPKNYFSNFKENNNVLNTKSFK